MKKCKTVLSVLLILALITACGKEGTADGASASFTFQATVLEAGDAQILVEPVSGSAELSSADQIYVSNPDAVALQVGDVVEITYDGSIMETYPAQLGEVYSIEIVAQE